jgi:hypothetical protein
MFPSYLRALVLVGILSGPAAHAALSFSVAFDDPLNELATVQSQVEQHVIAAGQHWAGHLIGNGSIEVLVRPSTSIPFAEGRSVTNSFVHMNGAFNVFEQGMTAEIRTGADPNGADYDVEILLNPDYAVNELWYDPDPAVRTATVDVNRTDAMSTFLHEFGHALGFSGWINGTDGTFPGDYQSTYDEHIVFDGTDFFFAGAESIAVNGTAPPLTYSNVYHVANFVPRPGENLLYDVMNGLVFYRGYRYEISALDLTMLADMGVPINDQPGDFDLDGDVDGRDFLIWQRGDSPNPLSPSGLADWQTNYGARSLGTSTSVPEPGCLPLLLGFVFLGRSHGKLACIAASVARATSCLVEKTR